MSNSNSDHDHNDQPQEQEQEQGLSILRDPLGSNLTILRIQERPVIAEQDRPALLIEHRPPGTLNLSEASRQIGVSEEFLSDSSNHPWLPSEISSDRRQYFSMLDVARYQAHMNAVRKRVEADQQRQRQQAIQDVFDAVHRGQQKGKGRK